MKKYLFLFALAIITMSQKCDESTADSSRTAGEGDYIGVKTTNCFGKCPVYEFKVFEDGNATFVGERFTVAEGTRTKKFSKRETESLFNAFDANDFEAFKDSYDGNVSDLPSIYLMYSKNGNLKKVECRYDVPDRLLGLASLIKSFANSEGWVKEK